MWMFPWIPADYNLPPTLYRIMNSMVNFDSEERTKIPDLSNMAHTQIFDFDYPLSEHINKDDFECLILDNFMMRRIGYETVTAWKMALKVKLNTIMPMYNKLFDSLDGWDLFQDGEVITRGITESGTTSASSNETTQALSNGSSTIDNRYSNTPQNRLNDIQDGTYMSEYTYNQGSNNVTSSGSNNITSSGNDSRTKTETVTKQPSDKIKIYKEFKENRDSIMEMIFKDLDPLFYGLV